MKILEKSKYLRYFSDIHLDFDVNKHFHISQLWFPEPLETDKDTTLVLAGDLWHAKKPFSYYNYSWIKDLSSKFQYVLIVLGNHDLWGGNMPFTYYDFRNKLILQEISNVFLLQNNEIVIGNNKFVGASLWTNYDNGNPVVMKLALDLMNDYKYIKYAVGYSKLKPTHLLSSFIESKEFIFNAKKDYDTQKLWVITHHAPSKLSIDENLIDLNSQQTIENHLYYSDLENFIENSDIDYWIHGHTHETKNYYIGKTNILSNPRGYTDQNTLYNPWILLNLE